MLNFLATILSLVTNILQLLIIYKTHYLIKVNSERSELSDHGVEKNCDVGARRCAGLETSEENGDADQKEQTRNET